MEAARVREKLATTLDPMSRSHEALRVLEGAAQAYAVAGAGEQEGLWRTTAHIGEALALQGRIAEGLQRLQPLADAGERGAPSPGLARLNVALAELYFHGGRYDECLQASERAMAVARAAGDTASLARAMHVHSGMLCMAHGLRDASVQVWTEAVRLLEATGDAVYLSYALTGLAEVYWHRGELAASRRYLARADEVERQLSGDARTCDTGLRGVLALVEGDWPQARRELEAAVRVCGAGDDQDSAHLAAYALSELGWLRLAEGRWAEATRALEAAWCAAAPSGDLQALRWAGRGLAELDVLQGQPDAAVERLLPLLDRPGLDESDVTDLLPLLAWAYLERGEGSRAADMAEQAVARARAHTNRLALVEALRVQALVAQRQGRWTSAAHNLQEGLALAAVVPYPYAEGRLLYLDGILQVERQALAPARERLEAAGAIFARLGACRETERVEQALAALAVV